MKKTLLAVGATALFSVLAAPAFSSWYPPGYVVQSRCQQVGDVQACLYNESSRHPYIHITYTGYLMADSWGEISAFVQINGQSIFAPLSNQNYTEVLYLNEPENVHLCYHNSKMERYSAQYPYCPDADADGRMALDWWYQPSPESERRLVEDNTQNGWHIQIALVDKDGRWDSQFGSNYRFHFPK